MPAITFRGTRNQRGYRTTWGIIFTLDGIACLALVGRAGPDAKAVIIAGVLLVVCGILGAVSRGTHTTIDSRGI